MTLRRTLGYVLALVPSAASADVPDVPHAPSPAAPTAPADPHAPRVAGSLAAPVVIMNPAPQPPRTPATFLRDESETYRIYDAWNAPVFATGALILAGSYGASTVVAATSDNAAADRLYVPVVGPWLALNDWGDCPIAEPRCDGTTTDKVLLVADGVFQAAGVVTMLTGLFSPSSRTVVARRRTADARKLAIRPTRNGFVFTGAF